MPLTIGAMPRQWRLARFVLWAAVLACASVAPVLAAEAPKSISAWAREVWTTREGLPHNQVNAIAQTPDGYLWFATWEGLARYNGVEFVRFDRSNVPQLQDNGIRNLSVGPGGDLLVATSRGGLSILHDGHWRTITRANGLAEDELVAAEEDARHRLWIATESVGLDRIDGEQVRHFGTADGLPSNVMHSLCIDRDGSIWVGTSGGLAHIVDDRVEAIPATAGLPVGSVSAIAESADGALWVGTQAGAYRRLPGHAEFDKMTPDALDDAIEVILPESASRAWVGSTNHSLLRVQTGGIDQLGNEASLPNRRIASLFRDRDGSLWAGTSAGLLRLRDTPISTLGTEQDLSDDFVRSLVETADHSLWIGTSNGLNAVHDDGHVSHYGLANGLPADSILGMAPANDGGVWLGTYASGAAHFINGHADKIVNRAQGLPGSQVRAILEEPDGTLWIGTGLGLARWRDGRMRVFTVADGLPRDYVLSLYTDASGRLWVGTVNGVAYRDGDRFTRVDLSKVGNAQDVFGFLGDPDGTLWMASDRGLLRWRNGRLAAFGVEQGLPVDTLFAVVADRIGNLWLTSNRGVMRVSRKQATAVMDGRVRGISVDLYGETDGMVSSQCNGGADPAALLRSDGSIWVATAKGASIIRPERLQNYRREPPQTVLEEVRINDQLASVHGMLDLPPGTRKIDVRYFALSYHLPKQIRYRYRLDGFDNAWSIAGQRTSVQFTNLPPGNYRLHIQAAYPGGDWSRHEAGFGFRIRPFFWQRPWVIALAIIILVLAAWLAYQARIRQIAANQRRLQHLVDERTEDLRLQTDKLTRSDAEKSELLELLRIQSEAFERQAREDALTGLANRRRVDEAIDAYFSESKRSGRPLGFAIMDIDFFKRINDKFSHATGDAVLRAIGAILREHQRPGDLAARLGGEEFVCVLAGSDLEGARGYCERMRLAIAGHDWSSIAPDLAVTISMGVVVWNGEESYSRLSSRADELLYRAKDAGRNRVEG